MEEISKSGSVLLNSVLGIPIWCGSGFRAMSDDIRLYLKVNELIESNNEHSEALRQLGNLFLEMHNQPGIWGFLGRATFAHYVKTRGQQPFARLKLIDTPPMLPKENDRADDIYPRRSIDAS